MKLIAAIVVIAIVTMVLVPAEIVTAQWGNQWGTADYAIFERDQKPITQWKDRSTREKIILALISLLIPTIFVLVLAMFCTRPPRKKDQKSVEK